MLQARAYAAAGALQVRLCLNSRDASLHSLHWETLCDPRLSLKALIVVASPSDQSAFGLAEIDVDGVLARVGAALGAIPAVVLGRHPDAAGPATLANLVAQLREGLALVILIAHETHRDGTPALCLERDDGSADWILGSECVAAVQRLSARPLLFALLSCQSAGRGYDDTLNGLGPRLAQIGVPAVLGFQDNVAFGTIRSL